jgi:hypothetical protein
MKLSPSWEVNSRPATQELSYTLRNPKFHYRVHKSPPQIPILSQMNPVHITTSYFCKIYLIMIFPLTSRSSSSSLFFFLFPQKKLLCIFLPFRASYILWPPLPLWLDHSNHIWRILQVMKPLIMWFSLQSPSISSVLGPNILLNTLFSNTFKWI